MCGWSCWPFSRLLRTKFTSRVNRFSLLQLIPAELSDCFHSYVEDHCLSALIQNRGIALSIPPQGFDYSKTYWEIWIVFIIFIPFCWIKDPKQLKMFHCPNSCGPHRVRVCVSWRWWDLGECYEGWGEPVLLKYFTGVVGCVDGSRFLRLAEDSVRLCAFVCGCMLAYGQSHTGRVSRGETGRVECEGWRQWLLWTTPLCPSSPPASPLILRQAHCKESPRTLSTQFSPWEISDINRSTFAI